MYKYEGIAEYLKYITDCYGLTICIKDYTGFLQFDTELSIILQPYLIHKNTFCMYIKSNAVLWGKCLKMKDRIIKKSGKYKDIFYGMCYCGMEEFIIPIMHNGNTIGAICAGEFCTNEKLSFYRLEKITSLHNLNIEIIKSKFKESVRQDNISLSLVKKLLAIVSEYFSDIYSSLTALHGDLNIKQAANYSNEAYILLHAIEYIKQNYLNNLAVKDISLFCHCSESYINHIFTKNMKINFKGYINTIKLEQAKALLSDSSLSIAEVASRVGFDDPNYFSSVFKKMLGVSPTVFRKKISSKN